MMIKEYTVSDYRGYERIDFQFAGHNAVVIFPKEAREDKPWVWRAEFLGAFDSVEQAARLIELDRVFESKGTDYKECYERYLNYDKILNI